MAWLASQRLRRRARAGVARVARYNGLRVTTELLDVLEKVCLAAGDGGKATTEGVRAASESSSRRHTVLLMIIWCVSLAPLVGFAMVMDALNALTLL